MTTNLPCPRCDHPLHTGNQDGDFMWAYCPECKDNHILLGQEKPEKDEDPVGFSPD